MPEAPVKPTQKPGARRLIWILTDNPQRTLATSQLFTANELRRAGWDVTVLAPGPAGVQYPRGIEVRCIPATQVYLLRQVIYHLRVLFYLLRHWQEWQFILFHVMSVPFIYPLKLLRRMQGRRLPLLVMDTRTLPMEDLERASFKVRLRGRFHRWTNRFANRWADGQTAITGRMAAAVAIPEGKLWGLWPSGVNPEPFDTLRYIRRWPEGEARLELTYVGVLQRERSLTQLCHAVIRAAGEGLHVRLSLLGDGTAREELETLAAGSRGHVRVLAPVPHEQVPRFLAGMHVGVLPFADHEKFRVSSPIKLFEYMAAGMPVLATRVTCHLDVVGTSGFAFWAEDDTVEGLLEGIRRVWARRAELARMGEEAAAAAQSFTWAESARKLITALEYGLGQAQSVAKGPLSVERRT